MKQKLLMMFALLLMAVGAKAQTYSGGDGSQGNPYKIASVADWNTFAAQVNGGTTYGGVYFKMTADIGTSENPVTTKVGCPKQNSNDYNTFNGTFDGDGHTLTVSFANESSDYCAPFAFTYGATIKNLSTAGTIATYGRYAGGVVGRNGTGKLTLINVKSNVLIRAFTADDVMHGGLVGYTINADLTGCIFTGQMIGVDTSTKCGGLVGWKTNTSGSVLNLKHCLFAPSHISIGTSGSQPFAVNNGQMTLDNCYVLSTVFGTGQGPQARSISAGQNVTVSPVGEPTEYDVSGITVYGNNLGLLYDNGTTTTFYAGQGVTLPVNLQYTAAIPEHHSVIYSANNATLSGEASPFSLTLDDNSSAAVTINASTVLHLEGSGTEADPYLIGTCADWDLLATNVNQGTTTYSGQYVELVSDLSFESSPFQMVGVSTDNCFRGTFNGKGHTISVTLIDNSSNDFCAPFRYINGTTIKYLHVDGTITKAGGKNAGGFVGKAKGTNYIIGCRSSVDILFNKDGDVSSGGFIGELRDGGTTNLINCTFDGQLRGANADHWGGFIGWVASGQVANFTNCLFAPQTLNVNNSNNSTFARRDGTVNVTNCYYKTLFGTAQGTDASNMTNDQLIAVLGAWEILDDKVVPVMKEYALTGSGTQQSPYEIASAEDWNHFAGNVALGNTYADKYLLLTDDISVSRMVGTDTQAGAYSFGGTFYGGGHTLTFTSTNIGEYNAPFRYVNGATIENLHVAGTITTSSVHAGGMMGRADGAVTIKNCISSVTITSSVNGAGHHGGFIADVKTGTTSIEGCRFEGKLLGENTTHCAGFVGDIYYNNENDLAKANVKNCFFCPSEITVGNTANTNGHYQNWYDGRESWSFVYHSHYLCYSLTNCFYFVEYFYNQGCKEAYSFEGGELVTVAFADEGTTYSLLGVTCYPAGFEKDGKLYGGSTYSGAGDHLSINITLNPAYTCTGFEVYNFHTQAVSTICSISGSGNPYTLNFGSQNVRIDPTGVADTPLRGTGTEQDPYLIEYPGQWTLINSAETLNHHFKLMIDLDNVTTWVESVFWGTFDGNNHTITVAYGSNGNFLDVEYLAPFRYAKGAVIKNLHVAGDIYTNKEWAAGIIGKSTCHDNPNNEICRNTTIINCRSSVTIHSNVQNKGTNGGLVAYHEGVPTSLSGGALNITGCLFDGSFVGNGTTKNCGGFVGWIQTEDKNSSVSILDCLFKPTSISRMHSSDQATFVRVGSGCTPTIERSYYTQAFGAAQGYAACSYTPTSVDFVPENMGAIETTYSVSEISTYENGLEYDGQFFFQKAKVDLISDADIVNDLVADVRLYGRTIYRDGDWNTLCLPFAVNSFTGTPLEGADVRTLESSNFDDANGELTLNFSGSSLTAIEAGKPYIVKYEPVEMNDPITFTATAGTGSNSGINYYAYPYIRLLDGDLTTQWRPTYDIKVNGVWYCEFHSSERMRVANYTISSGNNGNNYRPGSEPKDWVIKAKLNQDDDWTVIATVNNAAWENGSVTSKDYDFDQMGVYQYFRFECSQNAGDYYQLAISELRINGTPNNDVIYPVFNGVTMSSSAPSAVEGTDVDFLGTYTSTTFTEENKSILFLGGDNTLYYPQANASIGAFRAYFQLNGISAGDIPVSNVKMFFGDEATAVTTPLALERGVGGEAWYDLNGRQLNGKPTQRGIYINNGRKVVIK